MAMKPAPINRTMTLAGTAGIAAAVLIATAMLAMAPRPVQAFPAYAQKTGMTCGVCHENPKGGGKLNAYGTKWFTGGMKPIKPKR